MSQPVDHPVHFAGGLVFAESPLWHGDTLFVSDTRNGVVLGFNPNGEEVVTVAIEGQPNGLGALVDGRVVAASLEGRRLFTVEREPQVFADLAGVATGTLGDLTTAIDGRVFVDDIGYSPRAGESHRPGRVIVLDDGGAVQSTIEGLEFPNGLVHDAASDELIIAETYAARLSRWAPGRGVTTAEPWIDLQQLLGDNAHPDGLAVDHVGRLWVCLPFQQRCVALTAAGVVAAQIAFQGEHPIACTTGGRMSLFVAVAAPTSGHGEFAADLARGATKSRIVFAPLTEHAERTDRKEFS